MQYSNPTDITESSHDEDDGKWGQRSQKIESPGEQGTTLNSDPTKSKHRHSEVSVIVCGGSGGEGKVSNINFSSFYRLKWA